MNIVEFTEEKNKSIDPETRGDLNEPPRPEISTQMMRPLKIIFNVACQADLMIDAATSNRSPDKTVPKLFNPTGNSGSAPITDIKGRLSEHETENS